MLIVSITRSSLKLNKNKNDKNIMKMFQLKVSIKVVFIKLNKKYK